MRQSTNYNKVVNFDSDSREISVLQEIFRNDDNFKGATGCVLIPVSREKYESTAMDIDYVAEYLMDAMCFEDIPAEYQLEGGFKAYAEDIIRYGDDIVYDESYCNLWDSIREELNLTEDEAYIFDCISCGRLFGNNYQGNFNPELSKVIREYES